MFLTSPIILSSELRTSAPIISSALRSKTLYAHERLRAFLATTSNRRTSLNLRFASGHLFLGVLLVVAPQHAHVGFRDQRANVIKKALAVLHAAVRPKGNCCVSQVTKVADTLAIGGPSELRILEDRLL
jgi:hypothetical protein